MLVQWRRIVQALVCICGLGAPGCARYFPKSDLSGLSAAVLAANLPASPPSSGTPTSSSVINDSWSCSFGVTCQNVYDYYLIPGSGDTLNVNVTAVTGTSVARMSVFGPGVALNGTNLINGSTNDHICPNPPGAGNQDAALSGSVNPLSATGTYRIAIGRDWGNSGGAAGTYTLNVSLTSGATFYFVSKTVSNTATQSSWLSCP